MKRKIFEALLYFGLSAGFFFLIDQVTEFYQGLFVVLGFALFLLLGAITLAKTEKGDAH